MKVGNQESGQTRRWVRLPEGDGCVEQSTDGVRGAGRVHKVAGNRTKREGARGS